MDQMKWKFTKFDVSFPPPRMDAVATSTRHGLPKMRPRYQIDIHIRFRRSNLLQRLYQSFLRRRQRVGIKKSIRNKAVSTNTEIRRRKCRAPPRIEIGIAMRTKIDGKLTRPCSVDVLKQRSQRAHKFAEGFIWCQKVP